MGQVDERAFKTLVILISAALCILVIGSVCILILTNGVSKEMNLRAELISQLEARRRAEASNNYKSQFLANMSHELRTPMAAVIGLLDILISDDCLTNEQYSTVTQIRKCSTALLRLLNNILDLSKVESGKLVLEVAEFDLGRELEGLVDIFSVQGINHNIETVLDLSDDMPKVVRGDSARVVQIFANLINNSIKFTTSGHVILRGWCENLNSCSVGLNYFLDQKKSRSLQKSREKPNANHTKRTSMTDNRVILWFEVDDTGIGIDPCKWDSVFESFEQAIEVKPIGRNELPEDLFTFKHSSFRAPVQGWHMGLNQGMGISMQYNNMEPMPSFPQQSKSTNPFDQSPTVME